MRPHALIEGSRSATLRQWWSVTTTLIAVAILIEAVFAGAMLSGVEWARAAHAANAVILLASTSAASLVAIVTLRRIPHGTKLGLTLLSLAAVVFLQTAAGKLSAEGANLMWAHVPLGAALVGFAGLAAARARRLGGQ
ncbi:MAG: hypothetical protein Q8R02_18510 [Hyphomonadaceae bacterium]|nr:hypothetical protein [Hyphomonadaceae bacterium]